jgi:hypothetical protein
MSSLQILPLAEFRSVQQIQHLSFCDASSRKVRLLRDFHHKTAELKLSEIDQTASRRTACKEKSPSVIIVRSFIKSMPEMSNPRHDHSRTVAKLRSARTTAS